MQGEVGRGGGQEKTAQERTSEKFLETIPQVGGKKKVRMGTGEKLFQPWAGVGDGKHEKVWGRRVWEWQTPAHSLECQRSEM